VKGQSYTLDLVIAIIFASLIAVVVIVFLSNQPSIQQQQVDAKALSQLIGQPYPVPFTASTVLQPGFIVQGRFDPVLFAEFNSLSPTSVKQMAGISSDYYITVTDNYGLFETAGLEPVDARNVHAVVRFVAHNGSIARVEVLAWN